MPSDAMDMQLTLEAERGWELSPNVTVDLITEVKNSLMFSIKWEDLLQSAPTAISCMGVCFAASSSPTAVVQLHPPAGKSFEHLKYVSVQANLVECGNLGRYAFIEAEGGMGTINQASRIIYQKINDVIMCLGDPTSKKAMLKIQLNTIKRGAETCHQAAKKIEEKFNTWLLYACEMHSACAEQETNIRDSLLKNEIVLMTEKASLEEQQQAVDTAKKASELLKDQVATATEAFKKASENFPSGWDLLGQQIVGDLANSLSTGLSQAIPILIQSVGPLGKARMGAQIIGSLNNSPLDSRDASASQISLVNSVNAKPREGDLRRMNLPEATDPAYAEVCRVMTYLAGLKAIVIGNDGDINWELAKGDKGNTESSVKFLEIMISKAKDDFKLGPTAAEPSQTLSTFLCICLKVASEIGTEVEKMSNIRWVKPDSEQVKKWQTDFNIQYEKANTLLATARSLPGSSAKRMPLMTGPASVMEASQTNPQSGLAQAMLESAKSRLLVTQETLVATQKNYIASTDLLLRQKNRVGEIQANLKRLTASNMTLKEIKSILIECIKLVINLKDQITNLVRFFNGMSQAIDLTVQLHVNPFIDQISGVADPNGGYLLGKYTMEDLLRSGVYNAAVIVRSYFGVFGDIAKMWIQLSAESVMPGLRLCDELSVTMDQTDSSSMKRKVMELEKWSVEASARVSKLASEKQAEILQGMEKRIINIKQITAKIEPLPPSIQRAITDGIEVVKEAAQERIEKEEERSLLARFAIANDEDL
ncbi:hypothetical protein F5Y19DRAFT_458989 [Xylariaceae sp. FL1651]|nr:hypothetical protein F5Y19DRAFT_458989 [Xylariaceae sp. FL1651]